MITDFFGIRTFWDLQQNQKKHGNEDWQNRMMKFNNVYFFNGTAYAGKSTMVKRLAEKYDGIACEENYHESLMGGLDWNEFPNLGYTANLKDWADFIRRTPDEYK